ncbi:hypothetical protein [uncultured Psychroserpens sp.]|uniref:hypothetical protein n=1 Tax=uncultured Psychroserpens sp. TaxID=255436 RepID=UPI002603FCCE|nr:hypothetical protein [uncultured Psychroserpens sp.]
MKKQIKILQLYSLLLTFVIIYIIYYGYSIAKKSSHFDTIEVGRINIVEPNGIVKMVISNQDQFPQEISMDNWKKKHERKTPGILFYNAEGVESGGLIFNSEVDDNGNIIAGNHLSFDRFKQDQTIALTYQEKNGKYTSGLSFIDRPQKSLAEIEKVFETATQKQKDSMREIGVNGVSRIWLGTADEKSHTRGSFLVMNSNKLSNVLIISVDEEEGSISFMDSNQTNRLTIGLDSIGNPHITFFNDRGEITKEFME